MSDSTIQHLFSSLEHTVRERLDGIREVIELTRPRGHVHTSFPGMNTTYIPCADTPILLTKIANLESANQSLAQTLQEMRQEVASLRARIDDKSLLPLNPIEGIEVIPKREVAIPEAEPLSFADRLLLNTKARKALEAEEMGESRVDVYPLSVEEEVEEEAEEEEAEEAVEEAVELEEFEYKGSTYYRDSDNNVYMADEDGECQEQPFGTWNPVKQRIVMNKS